MSEEQKLRENIKKQQDVYRSRDITTKFKKRKEEIEKKLKEIRQKIIKLTNDMIREQDFRRQEIIQDQIDEQNKLFKTFKEELDDLKETLSREQLEVFEAREGLGIKKRKNRVSVINNKVVYPLNYRWDWQ
jgi:ferritin